MPGRLIIILLMTVICTNYLAAQLEEDKTLHFAAGAITGGIGALVASEISDNNKFWTLAGSVAGSLLAGTVKEAVDQHRYNGWDNADLGATVLGGVSAGVSFNIFTGKSKSPKIKQEVFLVRLEKTDYAKSKESLSNSP